MATITVDALDVVELAEIVEFLVGSVDTLVAPATIAPSGDGDAYDLNDLRADITRLVGRLLTRPPATSSASEPPEWITLNRCDVEEIAHILGQLEDALLHGDDEVTRQVTRNLTDTSPQRLASWVGELASHLRRQLCPPPATAVDPDPGRTRTSPADKAAPVTVEVDHGSASSRGRPPGQAWLVQLRCADRSVVIAVGLSHTAANHLAEHIADVIGPTATHQ